MCLKKKQKANGPRLRVVTRPEHLGLEMKTGNKYLPKKHKQRNFVCYCFRHQIHENRKILHPLTRDHVISVNSFFRPLYQVSTNSLISKTNFWCFRLFSGRLTRLRLHSVHSVTGLFGAAVAAQRNRANATSKGAVTRTCTRTRRRENPSVACEGVRMLNK